MNFISLIAASTLLAGTLSAYEGCADTKKEALFMLSGNIRSTVSDSFDKTVSVDKTQDSTDVQEKITSYQKTATNLSLVNIHYVKKDDLICAVVEKEDQVKNTKRLLQKALLYDKKNLPNDINEKVKKLDKWLNDLTQLGYLMPVFLEDSSKEQEILNKKEKLFRDLYTENLAKANSLIWKSCAKDQKEAKTALNTLMFKHAGKTKEKGFFDSITSIFSGNDDDMIINLFTKQITYTKKPKEVCAIIKKDELLNVTKSMYADMTHFSFSSLDKDPTKRYKEIQNLLEQLKVSKALIALYPDIYTDIYTDTHFQTLAQLKSTLQSELEKTHPQYVVFHIKGKQITLKLDNKVIKNNKKYYLPEGDYTYTITTPKRCPITGTLSLDKFENIEIEDDFEDQQLPTVIFVTDKELNIVLDGRIIKPNIVTPINKCQGEAHYVVKFAGQSDMGEIDLSANATETVELEFLSPQELQIFNDAKTKKFETTTQTKFSESLTPIANKTLEFVVESDVEHGTLSLHERGSFKYTSDKDFVGQDSFEYVIKANGKTSAPKVVNIIVKPSNIITKTIEDVKEAIPEDQNLTKKMDEAKKKAKEEVKKVKENVSEVVDEQKEAKYQRFKSYVDSVQDVETLKKLQKKYPDMFQRVLKEKLGE